VADGWADRDIAAVYELLETRNRKPRAQAPIC
jgi:hypothetical protein